MLRPRYLVLLVVLFLSLAVVFKIKNVREEQNRLTYTSEEYGFTLRFPSYVKQIVGRNYKLTHSKPYDPIVGIDFFQNNRSRELLSDKFDVRGDTLTIYIFDLSGCDGAEPLGKKWCSEFLSNSQTNGFSHADNKEEFARFGFVGFWVRKDTQLYVLFTAPTAPQLSPEQIKKDFELKFQ